MQQIKSVEMSDALQVSWKLDTNQNQKPQCIKEEEMEEENQNSKYKLRASSAKKRVTDADKGMPKKRGPKPRIRTQPMSKYRRKTANARERSRMGEINGAFENLRDKIPNPIVQKGKCEKLTKINILHVAINYINALENILETGEPGVQIYGTSLIKSPFKTEGESDSNDSGMVEDESSQCPRWEELQSTLDLNMKKAQQESTPSTLSNKKRSSTKKNKLGAVAAEKVPGSDPSNNYNWKYVASNCGTYNHQHQHQIFGHNNNIFTDFRVNKQHSGSLPFIKQEPHLSQSQQHQRILQQQQQHHGFPNSIQQQHHKHQQLHHRLGAQNSPRRFQQNQILKQMPTNLPSKQGILHELNPSCVRKPVTLSTRTEKLSSSPVIEVKKPLPEPSLLLSLGTEIFSDLCSSDTDDLFSDLNSSFDSFEDFSDINFVNEDPFPVFI